MEEQVNRRPQETPLGQRRESRGKTAFSSPALLFTCLLLYFGPWPKWRRGELNPRPEITRMAASTCLVGVLISNPPAIADTLRRAQAVCFSPADQRPNPPASPHFAAVASRATRRAEVACYQAAIRTGAAKPTRPATSLLAVNVLLGDLRGQRASSACHHHRRHPVETDRPRQ